MVSNCALTTVDNPFNPFDDFNQWFMFDIEKGYNCCGLLARMANYSDDLTDSEEELETEREIDKIIKLDLTDKYKKVFNEHIIQPKEE